MNHKFKLLALIFLLVGSFFAGCGDKSGGGSRHLTPPIENPTDTPEEIVWTPCARENGVCLFDGTALVRYGFGDTYVTQTATYAIACNNATFGDPLPGVTKLCEYTNLVAAPPVDNEGWIFCADENGHCAFTGEAEVRYGLNHIYFRGVYTNGVDCNNATFGDPLVGIVKRCEYRPR